MTRRVLLCAAAVAIAASTMRAQRSEDPNDEPLSTNQHKRELLINELAHVQAG